MERSGSGEGFLCLEVIPVRWLDELGRLHAELAIFGEVWPDGGVLQVETPVLEGTPLVLSVRGLDVVGRAVGGHRDEFGSYVEVSVERPEDWFSGDHPPSHLLARPTLPHEGWRRAA